MSPVATAKTASSDQRTADRSSARSWSEPGPSFILLLAVWLALVTGVVDASIIYFRQFVLHELVHRSPHTIWMAPVSYMVLFAIPALLFFILARTWPKIFPPVVALSLLVLGATTSILILLFYQKLHNAALMILAVGFAIQLGRFATSRLGATAVMVRKTTPFLVGIVVFGAAIVSGTRIVSEQNGLRNRIAARAGAPNVLLIILDTVRAASLSLYGYDRSTTPNLEQWAARGVVFDQAISPSSWTLPSHASLFTGRPPQDLSTHWLVPLDSKYPTLAEAFRAQGYRTGAFVANLQYATREMGLARGFDRYQDYPLSAGAVFTNSALGRFLAGRRSLRTLVKSDEIVGRKDARDINKELLSWSANKSSRPFFAFLNYYDAHDPYLPPDAFYRKFAGHDRPNRMSPLRRLTVRERRNGLSANDSRLERDSYDGSIAYLDHELDQLFRELERRGQLKNTLVVITSDHGEEFGEHDLFYHGNSLYLQSLHVPLVMWFPDRLPAGKRISEPVSLTSLAATISELALGAHTVFPGPALTAFWTGNGSSAPVRSDLQKGIRLPDWYPVAGGDMRSLVWQGKHYIENNTGEAELYDLRRDPNETQNVIRNPENKQVVSYLRSTLAVDSSAAVTSGGRR